MIRGFYEKTDSIFVKRSKANSHNARVRWEKEKGNGQDDENIANAADNAAATNGDRQNTEDHFYSVKFGVPYNRDGDYGNIDTGERSAASMNKNKEPKDEDYSITEIFGNPDLFR